MALPRVRALPPKWNERLRATLRAVLMAEAVAMRELRRAAANATIEARAESISANRDEDEDVIPVMLESSNVLYLALLAAILLLRKSAREEATTQFKAEAKLAGLELAAIYVTIREKTDEDQWRAESAARVYASAWLMSVMHAWRRGVPDPVRATNEALDHRLRRIAGTEVPQSYAQAHGEWLRLVVDAYGEEASKMWAKRWDATLDAKTCKVCAAMHGEVVPLTAAFSEGRIPGDVHPFCRCVPSLLPIPVVLQAAA